MFTFCRAGQRGVHADCCAAQQRRGATWSRAQQARGRATRPRQRPGASQIVSVSTAHSAAGGRGSFKRRYSLASRPESDAPTATLSLPHIPSPPAPAPGAAPKGLQQKPGGAAAPASAGYCQTSRRCSTPAIPPSEPQRSTHSIHAQSLTPPPPAAHKLTHASLVRVQGHTDHDTDMDTDTPPHGTRAHGTARGRTCSPPKGAERKPRDSRSTSCTMDHACPHPVHIHCPSPDPQPPLKVRAARAEPTEAPNMQLNVRVDQLRVHALRLSPHLHRCCPLDCPYCT